MQIIQALRLDPFRLRFPAVVPLVAFWPDTIDTLPSFTYRLLPKLFQGPFVMLLLFFV